MGGAPASALRSAAETTAIVVAVAAVFAVIGGLSFWSFRRRWGPSVDPTLFLRRTLPGLVGGATASIFLVLAAPEAWEVFRPGFMGAAGAILLAWSGLQAVDLARAGRIVLSLAVSGPRRAVGPAVVAVCAAIQIAKGRSEPDVAERLAVALFWTSLFVQSVVVSLASASIRENGLTFAGWFLPWRRVAAHRWEEHGGRRFVVLSVRPRVAAFGPYPIPFDVPEDRRDDCARALAERPGAP